MTFTDIVKMSFFLMRREDMDTLVEVRKEFLDGVRPAIGSIDQRRIIPHIARCGVEPKNRLDRRARPLL